MSSDEERVEAPLLENEYSDEDSEKSRVKRSFGSLRSLLLHSCFFGVNLVLFVILLRAPPKATTCEPPMIYSPARKAVKSETKTINVDFEHHSKFNGKPTLESDAAWNSLFKNANIRIHPDEIEQLGRTSIPISDDSGDSYGTLDVYHQLHCVKYIREYVHQEHFDLKPTEISHIDHVDHCIDMLRQVIMCRGDITLTTYSWIDNYQLPWPNFKLEHECRSWESIDEWSAKRAIDVSNYSLIVHPKLGPSFKGTEWNWTSKGNSGDKQD